MDRGRRYDDSDRDRSPSHSRSRSRSRRRHRPAKDKDSDNGSDVASVIAKREANFLRSRNTAMGRAMPAGLMRHSSESPKKDSRKAKKRFTFLTKAERQKLALERLEQKRAEQKAHLREAEVARREFFASDKAPKARYGDRRGNHRDGGRYERERDRGRVRGSDRHSGDWRRDKYSTQSSRSNDTVDSKGKSGVLSASEKKRREIALIKDEYLGKKAPKRAVIPPSQKFKFVFDWDASEDTTEQLNEFYTEKAPVTVGFGRGFMAGIDRDAQRKARDEYLTKELGVDALRSRSSLRRPSALALPTSSSGKQEQIVSDESTAILDFGSIEDEGLAMTLRQRHWKRMQRKRSRLLREREEARNWREKSLAEMTTRDWRFLKEEFRISTKFGGRLPPPIRFWKEASLPMALLRAVREVARYSEPSPVQRMAIPIGLANRDCVGIAETGSGKTCAFVLPMLSYIMAQPKMDRRLAEDGPYALVLAPARELARQIEEETKRFATFLDINVVCMIGGVDMQQQSQLLRDGAEVIIATPGRLLDSLEQRYVALNQCKYVVLDEADRMIDLGFEQQVTDILDEMPASNLRPLEEEDEDDEEDKDDEEKEKDKKKALYRQTFMFSATMPPAVERLTRKYLRKPVYITIGEPGAKAAENVTQVVKWVKESGKRRALLSLLPSMRPPIMVFVKTRGVAESVSKFLRKQEFSVGSLHAGKSQSGRESALRRFREGGVHILVCTNLAGRGIDVKGVKHVINFDMPSNIEDYTHRIGRTGRAGKQGVATSLLTDEDSEVFYDLRKMLLATGSQVPAELRTHEAALRDPRLALDKNQKKKKKGKMRPNL